MKIIQAGLEIDKDYRYMLVEQSVTEYGPLDAITGPQDAAQVMDDVFHLGGRAEEHAYLICLTEAGRPTGFFEISHGTCHYALAGPREVLARALLCGATGIILVHNHPGGRLVPSAEDREVTFALQDACRLMGIKMLDHIIVGQRGSWHSMLRPPPAP